MKPELSSSSLRSIFHGLQLFGLDVGEALGVLDVHDGQRAHEGVDDAVHGEAR